MKFLAVASAAIISLGVISISPVEATECSFPCFEGEIQASHSNRGKAVKRVRVYRGGGSAVSVARKYLGGNPTGMRRLWCARFMNMMEQKVGRRGTGSNMALSFARYGKGVSNPRPGDIAVGRRKGGGHVGYVVSVSSSKVTIISGNTGRRHKGRRRVGIGTYPKSRFFAYRRV